MLTRNTEYDSSSTAEMPFLSISQPFSNKNYCLFGIITEIGTTD